MALKEYIHIDLTTGRRLDVALFDDEIEAIPEDYKEGWGSDRRLFDPVWDFELNDWSESTSLEEILQPVREFKVDQLNQQCQDAIMKGFEYEGDFFQFNDKDQQNFNQQLSILLLDTEANQIVWKTENNGIKVFSREQFIETCKAGERHKRNSIGRYWQLKEYVLTHGFSSVEELEAINFDFEIPTGV